eukprot:GHRQ01034039.1.p2 GENE.GHRQ01034039.1~~GHRQ01034039.1.p2  ORF type:complete len:114 (+),score=20.16 GHRQ01034039.1:276-617(+)
MGALHASHVAARVVNPMLFAHCTSSQGGQPVCAELLYGIAEPKTHYALHPAACFVLAQPCGCLRACVLLQLGGCLGYATAWQARRNIRRKEQPHAAFQRHTATAVGQDSLQAE